MEFKILDFGSVEKAAVNLDEFSSAMVELTPVLTRVYEDMLRAEQELFNSQGRRGGGSWAKLKPDTIKRKNNSKILINTGQLEASLTVPGAPFQIYQIGQTEIIFGTDDPKASIHQGGAPNRGIPARPVLKFTNHDYTRWGNWITQHLMRGFSAA